MPSHPAMLALAMRVGVGVALACALLLAVAAAPRSVGAAACVVNVTTDGSPAPAGSLREKVSDATCDSITFTVPSGSTITLTEGQLEINRTLTITGPGAADLTVSGNNASRIFNITGGTVAISGLTVANGNAPSNGGGVLISSGGSLSLDRMIFRNNATLSSGGAIASEFRPVTVTNSTIRDNTAQVHGGGIGMIRVGAALTLSGTTLSGNQAQGAESVGGGVHAENGATATISNSTIVGNSAVNRGGALAVFGQTDGATITATHVTISGNTGGGRQIVAEQGDTIRLKASIVVGVGANCQALSGGNVANDGYNVDSSNSCGFGNTNGNTSNTNPLLAPLGSYGGATQTFALLPGSPAIDRVLAAECATITTDQRGSARPQPTGGACDAGAFESRGFTMSLVNGNNQSTVINTAFANPLRVQLAANDTGVPVQGGRVTFTGPGSGAGIQGSPLGGNVNANERAAVTPDANGTAGGPYTVTASAAGVATGVSFSLTNLGLPTTLVAADASGTYGGTTTLSATLTTTSDGAAVADKTIVFTLNETLVCGTGMYAACPKTNSSGVATLSDVPLELIGANTYGTGVGVSFTADTTHAASDDTAQLTVTQASTSVTSIAASPSSIAYGAASVSLGALVNNTSNDAVLTGGNITFRVTNAADTVTYCTQTAGPIAGGDPTPVSGVTCPFTTLPPVGNATIRAEYGGDTNVAGSSGTGTLTITQAATRTTIGTPASAPSCGDPTITVPVTVANDSNSAALTGGAVTVRIVRGATVLATGSAPVAGADPVTVNVVVPAGGLPAGTYGVEADYDGDGNFADSTATPGEITVTATSSLTVLTATASYGDASVALMARVANANGAALNGGTVTFRVMKGQQILATLTSGAVNGASPVTVSVTLPLGVTYNAGNYTIEASYPDNVCLNLVMGTGMLQVQRKIVWVKPQDRTVVLKQPNPPTAPPANCLAQATATTACWLELVPGSSFVYGQSWSALNLANLRFAYNRSGTGPATERVGAQYRITVAGALSQNYDLRYQTGLLTVVAAP